MLYTVALGSYFTETYQLIPVGASSFEVSKIAQLSDGAIGFHNDYYYYNAEHYNQWLSELDQTANGDLSYVTEVRFGTEDDYVLI